MDRVLYYQVFQKMSGLFLTEEVPWVILESDDVAYFETIDDFVREHVTEMFEGKHPSDIIELIDDATRIAMRVENNG